MKFKIRIKGHMDKEWADWFDKMKIKHEKDGTTTIYGPLPDQTALYSVLRKIRDLNLRLISVEEVNLEMRDETLGNSERDADPE